MADYKVSMRYATSLLEDSNEKKMLEPVSKDMEFVVSVIGANNKLKLMLVNPVIKSKVKISVLEEIFKTRISKDSMDFLIFVVSKNREDVLYSIIKKFLELKDDYLGIVNVQIKSAQELSREQHDNLRKKFESFLNKKVRFKFEIDESIIGGFVARAGDTIYDASIKHQLDILKKQFVLDTASMN